MFGTETKTRGMVEKKTGRLVSGRSDVGGDTALRRNTEGEEPSISCLGHSYGNARESKETAGLLIFSGRWQRVDLHMIF
jgi:hypothetical protein